MPNSIQLLIGLANPGKEYSRTRHNAGAWFIQELLNHSSASLRAEKKFHGRLAKVLIKDDHCFLFVPDTYMNNSGQAASAIAGFYRIPVSSILVIHDDLDLPPGTLRVKQGGGEGGHNGLRSVTEQLGSKNYWRLRIGIGHPGHRDQVHSYVLSSPSESDHKKIMAAILLAKDTLPLLVSEDQQKAMQILHSFRDTT